MSTAAFLETILSLSLQVAVMVAVCAWLVRQTTGSDTGHRLWATCHAMILGLTLSAILLPHLRLVPHSVVTDHLQLEDAATAEYWLGQSLLWAWGLGAILYAVAVIVGMLDLRRILATATPMLRCIEEKEGEVTILLSSRVHSPFCWQMQRPIVVLPERAQEFPHEELCAIIRHELAHLRSGHPVALFLQRLVEMLYWFHPAIWWASKQAELHREFHCDRASNRDSRETANYLRSLLRLCELAPQSRFGLPAGLNFQGNPSLMRLRVERLMQLEEVSDVSRSRMGFASIGLIAAALLMTVLWLPVNVEATSRSLWSPWPSWSASALFEFGIPARDYEIDGHRLHPHEQEHQHTPHATPTNSASSREDADG
ncbi:MAG: M56 family metallopeptidase [Planctomycetaceae bacterium]|nr:M56 family metallopeptidase [Planctomycetaceae bacterium]